MSKNTMSKAAAARIQSAQAKSNNGTVTKGSFAARAQSTASKSGEKSAATRDNNPPKTK
ncbi:hypothetical protein [uncultured Psychrosphaera sp.]|uniref:hypothetical protein n=1 Tax=uncultured Psychrosphaera sp. TaxID=1403522 RepID=UPI00262CDC1D|nr:hypothetical protein [uncultured Psychrosphaera sp.]